LGFYRIGIETIDTTVGGDRFGAFGALWALREIPSSPSLFVQPTGALFLYAPFLYYTYLFSIFLSLPWFLDGDATVAILG